MLAASVIVPARNAQRTLARTLQALAAQDVDGGYEVLVVDDGSDDDTAAIVRSAPEPVALLQQAALGPAAARNLGVARSSAAKLAFCDADVFPTAGWLRAGLRALERADLVQGRVEPDPDAVLGPFDRTLWITSEVGLWETANLFVDRALFDRVGGFEEWIRPPGGGKALAEDVWFGYRALRAGAAHAFSPAALAHHAVFERGWAAYVSERQRLRYFPAMAHRMPELRESFLHRRWFLSRRSLRFDLAVIGGALALAVRSPLPLAAGVPYLRAARAHAARAPGRPGARAAVAAADTAADFVGLLAMARGSVRYGSVVI